MSAPGRRRSVSLRRPIVNSGLSMLTMRRPRASVTTSRGAGGASAIWTRLYISEARSGRSRYQDHEDAKRTRAPEEDQRFFFVYLRDLRGFVVELPRASVQADD